MCIVAVQLTIVLCDDSEEDESAIDLTGNSTTSLSNFSSYTEDSYSSYSPDTHHSHKSSYGASAISGTIICGSLLLLIGCIFLCAIPNRNVVYQVNVEP